VSFRAKRSGVEESIKNCHSERKEPLALSAVEGEESQTSIVNSQYSIEPPPTIPCAHCGKKYDIIKLWGRLPGIGLIRATTLFAYLDTPWRFKQKNKLWKYCGVGLQRTTSGTDKKGRPKPARLKLPWAVNRTLKNAVLGAAISAINQKNCF